MGALPRLAYGIAIVLAFLLTLVALFTPGWRSYKGNGSPDIGIVTYQCGEGNRKVNSFDCGKWAQSKATFEKATLALVICAAIFEALAVCCFCTLFSPRMRMSMPAFIVCLVAFVCLFIAVVVYGVRYQNKIAYMTSQTFELIADVELGYSYWITVVAMFLTLVATAAAAGLIGNASEPMEHHQQ